MLARSVGRAVILDKARACCFEIAFNRRSALLRPVLLASGHDHATGFTSRKYSLKSTNIVPNLVWRVIGSHIITKFILKPTTFEFHRAARISYAPGVFVEVVVVVVVAKDARHVPGRGPQTTIVSRGQTAAVRVVHPLDGSKGAIGKRARVVGDTGVTRTVDRGDAARFVVGITHLRAPRIRNARQLSRQIVAVGQGV